VATGWEVGGGGVCEEKQDGGIEEKAREQDVNVRLEWNKRAGELVRDRKISRYEEIDILKRIQRQVMSKSKKKRLAGSDKNKKARIESYDKEKNSNLKLKEVKLDVDNNMQVGSITDESEKEVEENEVGRRIDMDIEEVIGINRGILPTCDVDASQVRCSKDKENKENGEKESRENRDRMIIVDGIMQYEVKAKEKSTVENRNNFRFKGDHKGSFILAASVKKEKAVKGKVGNAVRIATKTMAISNRIIKIKHLGYNRREIYIKDAFTANKLHGFGK